MKRVIFLIAIFTLSTVTITFANPLTTGTTSQNVIQEQDYTIVKTKNKTVYYDKYGRMIAHDKYINNQTFFYDKVGQLIGKSLERSGVVYYYNPIGKFLGTCDVSGCKDSEFNSTGNVPPLPKIVKFVPVFDPEILNPSVKKSEEEEE